MKDDSKLRRIFFLTDPQLSHEEIWRPFADVYRVNGGWILKFDLAGVRLEDVKIVIHGNRVELSGVRRDCIIEKNWTCYSSEINYSHFERSITLPQDIEASEIKMEYRDGILLIRVLSND
jgi:HSP20 family protein